MVAIIGVLAALAVPGLGAAQRAARKTTCLNNLKQLQLCWQLYVTDFDDAVPPNRSFMTNGVWRSTPDSWIGFSSAPHDADTRAIEQGLLYRYDYNRQVRIYHCPEDRSTVRGSTLPRTRSYSMNGAFGGRKEDQQPVVIQKAGEVRHPARAFVFVDEHEDSIDDAHFLVWPAPDTRWVNVPADRHSRGCTLSLADGHTEYWKWRWPKERRGWPTYYKEAENGADLADLRQLQAALPNAE